ncbi:major capsid protein [Capybara microvirus Cap1_SP_178]|nr:major capsid protein [Capybara microvirus Cap1_SP_178]
MRSSSQHLFSQVPSASIPRSSFKRDMTWKTTFDSGYLVPIYVDEVLPGDTFNLKLTSFARLSTPVVPFMDNLYMDFFFFYCPLRLLWFNFTKMMGEQEDPDDSIDYLCPIIEFDSAPAVGSLHDYLGLPLSIPNIRVNAFWHRAYNLIWNEWFRDENLQSSVIVPKGDGPDKDEYYALLKRGKRHDYFTSCLPWTQKGDSAGVILDGTAPIYGDGSAIAFYLPSANNPLFLARGTGSTPTSPIVGSAQRDYPFASGTAITGSPGGTASGALGLALKDPNSNNSTGLYADLSRSVGITVNSLREGFAIQRLLERFARGGSRYTEILQSCFGVVSPDSRLQRPEYLGGGSTPIQIHSVAQTSATDSISPQGNLAAYGVSASKGIGFVKSFVEHGVILGLACVRADLTYQQGLHRMFSRRSRLDFYWPALHNLGEQAVLNKEIYCQGDLVKDSSGLVVDDQAFGYQERWAEYRYGVSRITGKLRSTDPQTLDYWHLAQKFTSLPALNSDFISENPPLKRVLAVQDEPEIIYDSLISLNCVRPMGVFSVPGMVDHL